MAEYIPPEGQNIHGHLPNSDGIALDLYRLLTIFLSDKELAMMGSGRTDDPVENLRQFGDDEITRILITTAITARILDDGGRLQQTKPDQCGELIVDLERPADVIPLTLREACNKIIHMKSMHGDVSEVDGKRHLNPILYFYGQQKTKNWKATLNIVEYAKTYAEAISGYA